MLPDQDRQLLTAYVDGELSSRQRRRVVRLLQRSMEARQLLHDLQKDSSALINLDAPKLDEDLSPAVLHTIRERRLTPRRRPKPLQPALPGWAAMAIAASILCMIGLASYVGFAAFLAQPPASPSGGPVAQRDEKSDPKPEKPIVREEKPEPRKDEKKPEDKPQVVRQDPPPRPEGFVGPPEPEKPVVVDRRPPEMGPVVVDRRPPDMEPQGPPEPEQPKRDPLTNAPSERFELERIVGIRRFFTPLHNLDQADRRQKLLDELTKDSGFRVELPCENGTRAFDRIRAACRDLKINIVIDQTAAKRLNDPKMKTSYILYIEDVTSEELCRLVQQIGAEDKLAASKKSSDAYFGSLVVTQMTRRDYRELSDLLGVDASKMEPPAPKGPLGTDLHKPFSEQTGEQVAKGVSGDKTTGSHQALVVAYNTAKTSAEVKRFLESRKPVKPGTVRAMIVLRSL